MKLRITSALIIVLLIFSFHVLNNYSIVTKDSIPFVYDAAGYFETSLEVYRLFRLKSFLQNPLEVFSLYTRIFDWRPPLFMIAPYPYYMFFGRSMDVAQMSNSTFLLVLIVSIYLIGKKLRDEKAGLLAAFIVTSFPIIFGFSRLYWADFALTAMVSLSICLLLYTENFRSRNVSILFGISLGLGALTKLSFVGFIIGPLFYCLIEAVHFRDYRIRLNHFLIALLLGVVIMSGWYIPNIKLIWRHFMMSSFAGIGRPSSFFSAIGFYVKGLFSIQLYPSYFFIFALCVVYSFVIKAPKTFLLVWFLVPYLFNIAVSINPRIYRYLLPVLPSIGLYIALTIYELKYRKLKTLVWPLVLLGLVQFYLLSYTDYGWCKTTNFPWERFKSGGLLKAARQDWDVKEIVSVFDKERVVKNRSPIKIVVLASSGIIPSILQCWQAMEDIPVELDFPINLDNALHHFTKEEYYVRILNKEYILGFDYVFSVEDRGQVIAEQKRALLKRLRMIFNSNVSRFKLLRTIGLPQGMVLSIYEKRRVEEGNSAT